MSQENKWNEKYAQHKHLYSDQPNQFIRNFFESVNSNSKKVILPGDGDGRNGLWLARQGFDVSAFDYAEVAVDKANRISRELGLNYKSQHLDVTSWNPVSKSFDYVVLVFLHLEDAQRKHLMTQALKCLRPGGAFICQVFSKDQMGKTSGGPKDLSLLYDLSDFELMNPHFAAIELEKKLVELEEGPFHTGTASVINFIGKGFKNP